MPSRQISKSRPSRWLNMTIVPVHTTYASFVGNFALCGRTHTPSCIPYCTSCYLARLSIHMPLHTPAHPHNIYICLVLDLNCTSLVGCSQMYRCILTQAHAICIGSYWICMCGMAELGLMQVVYYRNYRYMGYCLQHTAKGSLAFSTLHDCIVLM